MTPVSNQYRAKMVRGGGYSVFDTGRLCISIGQSYHEGDKLKAAFEWAATRFPHIVVSMADTLQRYNGLTHEEAREAGDNWLKRNSEAFVLIPDAIIQRWDDWLNKPEYPTMRAAIEKLYNNHQRFKADVDDAAAAFAEKRGTPFVDCRNYLLEETSVFAIQPQAVDIYPASLSLWEIFKREHIEGAPDSLSKRHYTRIGFVRCKL